MLKKLKEKIERKRSSKKLFWKTLVFTKDYLWQSWEWLKDFIPSLRRWFKYGSRLNYLPNFLFLKKVKDHLNIDKLPDIFQKLYLPRSSDFTP